MINLLFESGEVLRKKVVEIEKKNIAALRETNRELAELFNAIPKKRKHKVIYVNEHAKHTPVNNFPIDHRIAK